MNRRIILEGGDPKRDALATLGTIIDEFEKRDAIHLAVEPAIAAHSLRPGEHVGFVEGGVGICDAPVGIVDPFLKSEVRKGERFWLVVYPRTITSLRHVWTHPAFEEEATKQQKKDSEAWLREFCRSADCPGYDVVMEVIAKGNIGDGYDHCYLDDEYIHFGGRDAHGDIPSEFWDHVEVVTGKKMTQRPKYFSCSC